MPFMKTRTTTLFSTAAMAFGAALLLAPHVRAADENTKLNTADTRFIQNEAAAGVALVKMAELGAEKAKREEVKDFAGKLVADHSKANSELTKLAASKSVELSTDPVAKYGDMQDKLERTSGAEFDRDFLAMIVASHEKCVKRFEEASTTAEDAEVKAWATKMLPALQAHHEQAVKLSAISTTKTEAASTRPSTRPSTSKPDNTARNMRDRDFTTLTPLDQGNSKADIDTTAKIRSEIVDLKGLSVNAQNVKIITNEGRVTLRGPVDSVDEKRLVGEIATRIATAEQTDNQLEVRGSVVK